MAFRYRSSANSVRSGLASLMVDFLKVYRNKDHGVY
uniref:Uncharacterized protein n=1 Tax=Rhizophora mucronata TaxID=61149 RepID=A0A2P2J1T5_RHIMU